MGTNAKNQFKIEKLFKTYVTLSVSFLFAYTFASIFTPVESSSAVTCTNGSTGETGQVCDTTNSDISVTVENPYYITVTSSAGSGSGVALNYTNDSGNNLGDVIAAADTVTTTSNTGKLKHLYISTTSSSSNNLTGENTDLDNNKTYLAAGGGDTLDAAAALSDNTWGFALPSTTSGLPDNTFDTSYSPVSASSKFTKVPTLGNDILIQEEIGTENAETGEYKSTATVYYGTLATTDIYAGSYSNTIRYTAYSEEPVPLSTYMQDFTNEMCNDLTTDRPITLKDSRDEKTYSVTKFRDGNCWMSQNLALDGTDASTGEARVLTPADSNVSENRTLAKNITSGTTMNGTDIQIYAGDAEKTTTSCSYTYCVTSDAPYGNYYNWVAATAGVGNSNTTGTAFESVCPKGWRLPDNTGNHSYSNLVSKYSYTNSAGEEVYLSPTKTTDGKMVERVQQSPLNFPLAGAYSSSSVDQADGADYWSRTSVSDTATYAYYLYFYSSNNGFSPQNAYTKSLGFSVRCVLYGDDVSNLTYMQDMTTDICNKMSEGATKTLYDARGNYSAGAENGGYGIIKAKDGNCWMTSNFNLYNATIYAASSDFSSGSYTIQNTSNWTGNVYTSPKVHRATNANYTDQVYYNWTSAVALTDGSTTTQQNQSICPKNWQLPINGDKEINKSYAMLLDKYEITTGPELVANTTLGFTYSGVWSKDGSGSENGQGTSGSFWSSSTPTSAGDTLRLWYDSTGSSLNPQYNVSKGYGFSIRCVSR